MRLRIGASPATRATPRGTRGSAPRRRRGPPRRHGASPSVSPRVDGRRRANAVARRAPATSRATRERHLVPRSASSAREARPPRAAARRRRRVISRGPPRKSIATGTPSQLEPLAQLVLDPVAVVARDEPRVVDGEPEARRPRRDLCAVEEVEAPLALRRRLARLASARPRSRLSSPVGIRWRACRTAPRPCRARASRRGRSSTRS